MILKLAWRNIWRNRRRSTITMSSILFGVFFAVLLRALQLGTYDRIIDNVVSSFIGYAQIHAHGYWDDPVLDNALEQGSLPEEITSSVGEVRGVFPRIESFALCATETKTEGGLIVGLEARREEPMLGLEDKLLAGEVFQADDAAVLLAAGLARNLSLSVGDTLVVLGQGYHGVTAAGKYPVCGIVKFPSPDMNLRLVLLPLAEGQRLFGAEGLATSLVLLIDEPRHLDAVVAQVEAGLDMERYEIRSWRQIVPELLQTIQADNAGGLIMVLILYLVIVFGIFGTLLMMMNEREFEFGVLLSVGMNRGKLIATTLCELVILALMGAGAGMVVSYPVQRYFHHNPIQFSGEGGEAFESFGWEPLMVATADPMIPLTHAIGVLIVTLLLSLYAVVKIRRLHPVQAMRR
jgi:ABC-type lipoprotein release transport system permease subunit